MASAPIESLMTRTYTRPKDGETLRDIASRVFPDDAPERATELLLLWNLHLTNRINTGRGGGHILCSDIVFTEPAAS